MVDVHDQVAIGGSKADTQFAIPASRMEGDAAASSTMGVDQVIDRAFDPSMGEGIDHDLPLPGAIGRWMPVLDRAAAASAEIPAERCNPLCACRFDADQRTTVGM